MQDKEIIIERCLKYLAKYKKGILPKTQSEILEVSTTMEKLNSYLYEIRKENKDLNKEVK